TRDGDVFFHQVCDQWLSDPSVTDGEYRIASLPVFGAKRKDGLKSFEGSVRRVTSRFTAFVGRFVASVNVQWRKFRPQIRRRRIASFVASGQGQSDQRENLRIDAKPLFLRILPFAVKQDALGAAGSGLFAMARSPDRFVGRTPFVSHRDGLIDN